MKYVTLLLVSFLFSIHWGFGQKSYFTRHIITDSEPSKSTFKSPHIKIGVLLPNDSKSQCSLYKVLPAIDVAIDTIRTEYGLFRSSNFSITYSNSHSDLSIGPLNAIDIFNDHLATVMLGPVNSFILANVVRYSSKRYKVPILSAEGFASDLGSKDLYPLLTRLSGTYLDMGTVFKQVFNRFEWQSRQHPILAVWYIWNKYNEYECNFQTKPIMDEFRKSNIKYIEIGYDIGVMGKDKLRETIIASLKRIKTNVRIVILCSCLSDYIRMIMIHAHEMGLTNGDFVFFNIDLSSSQAKDNQPWLKHSAADEENEKAKLAYRSLLILTFRLPDTKSYKKFIDHVQLKSKSFYNYNYKKGDANSCVGLFHDAILLYSFAVNETLNSNHSITDGDFVTKKMWNRSFPGITGEVSIDSSGDGHADYSLLDMNPETGSFEVVATFLGKNNSLVMADRKIDWGNAKNRPPPDTPKCGFDNSGCRSISDWLISVLVIIILIVFAVIGVIIYVRKKMTIDLNSINYKIPWDEIETQENRQRRRSVRDNNNSFANRSSFRGNSDTYVKSKQNRKVKKEMSHESINLLENSAKRKRSSSIDSQSSTNSVVTLGGIQLSQLSATQMFAKTGIYKGNIVALKHLHLQNRRIDITKKILIEIKMVKDLNNNHIARLVGICLDPGNECIVSEYCPKGSLQDVLENEQIKLDWMFRLSLMQDMCRGMIYLQSTIGYHGNLKSSNCLVDSRFVLKITDFGLPSFRRINIDMYSHDSFQFYKNKLWTAPELLRNPGLGPVGLAKADVYSFAIICQEIIYRCGVFYISDVDIISPDVVVNRVKKGECPPYRPKLQVENGIHSEMITIISNCWNEEPNLRPAFPGIKLRLRRLNGAGDGDILDNLLSRMEQYANNLEGLVAQRTQQYYEEKKKAEDLLYSMLPRSVAGQLIRGEMVTAEAFDSVTIYFSDICGFTELSASSTPMEVIALLNKLYTLFDSILEEFDVYKVETIGDAYMVVSGLPQRNGEMHAKNICCMSIAFLSEIFKFKIPHKPDQQLKIRIGIHTGMVCAGVVGVKMPRYCLFGDTVNTASRMESNGMPLKIHVSEAAKRVLDTFGEFVLTERGNVEMKGKGVQKTYWLHGTLNNIVDPLPKEIEASNW